MEGLRCAVCKERFVVGDSVRVIGDTTVSSDAIYEFDMNDEGEQEICAIHPNCGTIVLHFERYGEERAIAIGPTE